jgi:hypothetical protein
VLFRAAAPAERWPAVKVVRWCFWNMVAEKGGSRGQAQQQCITTARTCKRQQPSVHRSRYTRPIARFLVGNGRFKCPYVIRSEGRPRGRSLQAAARAASRVPRQLCPLLLLRALSARWSRRMPVYGADRAMSRLLRASCGRLPPQCSRCAGVLQLPTGSPDALLPARGLGTRRK